MGAKLSKWHPHSDIPQSVGIGGGEGDTTGQYETTGDIFTDIIQSCELTNKERKELLKMLRKKFPASYKKRFGYKTIDDVLAEDMHQADVAPPADEAIFVAERLNPSEFRRQGYEETFNQIRVMFYGVLEDKNMNKKQKFAKLAEFDKCYPAVFNLCMKELGCMDDLEGEQEGGGNTESVTDSGPGADCGGAGGGDGDKKAVESVQEIE